MIRAAIIAACLALTGCAETIVERNPESGPALKWGDGAGCWGEVRDVARFAALLDKIHALGGQGLRGCGIEVILSPPPPVPMPKPGRRG